MADEVTQHQAETITIDRTDLLYRGINPEYFPNGNLMSVVFPLNKNHTLQQGPSVGIAKLISLEAFHSLMHKGWGVGSLLASAPQDLSLRVHPLPEPGWKEHSRAHAVITDYQKLTNKKLGEAQKALRDELRKAILILPAGPKSTLP